jgi:hypothetical protein
MSLKALDNHQPVSEVEQNTPETELADSSPKAIRLVRDEVAAATNPLSKEDPARIEAHFANLRNRPHGFGC